MLWRWIILFLPAAALVNADFEVVYVRSSDNVTCTAHPCFTFSEYATEVNQYFKDNTTFLFMAGIHHLNTSLHIENVSEVRLNGLGSNSKSVQIFLSPLVNITWTNCDDIEISGLVVNLNRNSASQLPVFSALMFEQTAASISHLAIFGLKMIQ